MEAEGLNFEGFKPSLLCTASTGKPVDSARHFFNFNQFAICEEFAIPLQLLYESFFYPL